MPGALQMDRARHQFFPCPVCPGNQHATISWSRHRNQFTKPLHRRRRAHQFKSSLHLNSEIQVFLFQLALMQRIAH